MDSQEIIEGNRLIVEFMQTEDDRESSGAGFYCLRGYALYKPEELRYHASWDWLMPVVEKITPIAKEIGQQAWRDTQWALIDANIEHVYVRVIQFIKYYNTQQHEKR